MIVQKMLGLLLISIEDVLDVFNHKLIRHFISLKAGNLGQLKFSPNITQELLTEYIILESIYE